MSPLENLPAQIKMLDIVYAVSYVDKPSDVDSQKRQSLFGQVDYWTRSIRVYANDRSESDIRQTLWHELIHALCEKLHIETKEDKLMDDEQAIDLLATGINTLLQDNPKLRGLS